MNSWGDDPEWGSEQGDVWVGGPARDWLLANLNSETPVSSADFGCSDWRQSASKSLNTEADDSDGDYFECDCDCDSDDDECEAECQECLADSKAHMHFH